MSVDPSAQIADGVLAYPAAKDVEPEFDAARTQDECDVGGAKPGNAADGAALESAVDDAPLQLQRPHGQNEEHDGQRREPELMARPCLPDISEDVRRHCAGLLAQRKRFRPLARRLFEISSTHPMRPKPFPPSPQSSDFRHVALISINGLRPLIQVKVPLPVTNHSHDVSSRMSASPD